MVFLLDERVNDGTNVPLFILVVLLFSSVLNRGNLILMSVFYFPSE